MTNFASMGLAKNLRLVVPLIVLIPSLKSNINGLHGCVQFHLQFSTMVIYVGGYDHPRGNENVIMKNMDVFLQHG